MVVEAIPKLEFQRLLNLHDVGLCIWGSPDIDQTCLQARVGSKVHEKELRNDKVVKASPVAQSWKMFAGALEMENGPVPPALTWIMTYSHMPKSGAERAEPLARIQARAARHDVTCFSLVPYVGLYITVIRLKGSFYQ